jgi:hypothetical protein
MSDVAGLFLIDDMEPVRDDYFCQTAVSRGAQQQQQ